MSVCVCVRERGFGGGRRRAARTCATAPARESESERESEIESVREREWKRERGRASGDDSTGQDVTTAPARKRVWVSGRYGHIRGLSECSYVVQLIPVHHEVPLAPRYPQKDSERGLREKE